MAREINLTSNEWCNIIFEGKNKEFGAYILRRESSKRHYVAFAVVTLLVFLVSSLPKLTSAFGMNKEEKEIVGIVDIFKLSPPEKEKEPFKPQIEEPTRLKTAPAIKFLVPVIKPDDEVKPEDEIPPMEAVTKFEGIISSVNNKGEDSNGVDPATVNTNNEIGGEAPIEDELVLVPEVQPSFPGGERELMKFLNENIKHPALAIDIGIQGKVQVQFIVGKDGSIEDVKIARGVDKSLDNEAIRVIKSMPKWIPGKQSGKAVRVKFYVPVNFRLE